MGRLRRAIQAFHSCIEPGGINEQAAGLFGPNPYVKDGMAHFEAGPGWGVKINPEWLRAASYQKSKGRT